MPHSAKTGIMSEKSVCSLLKNESLLCNPKRLNQSTLPGEQTW